MFRLYRFLLIFSALWIATFIFPSNALNVAILGDSNTWIGGDDCSNPRGWNYWLAQKDSTLDCHSYARSGATWTNTANTEAPSKEYSEVITDNNVIYNQVARLIVDTTVNNTEPFPDVVIVMAGTNDAWFQERRPGIFSLSAKEAVEYEYEDTADLLRPYKQTSLAGSVRLALDLMKRGLKDSRLVVLTPIQTTATSLQRQQQVSDIIEEVAKGMDIECLRLDTLVPIHADEERVKNHYTTDGTHTSEKGARLLADIIYQSIFHKQ